MFEECEPPILVSIVIGRSEFGDAVVSIEAATNNYIQEIMFLGGCLTWNNAAVCGGRIWLNFFVSVCSNLWKSCERESTMIFSVPLMCCEYRDFLLLTSVYPSQNATTSCDSAFIGSKDSLCIHPSDPELSVNSNICDPFPICRMVM